MRRLRTASTRRLTAIAAITAVVVLTAGIAQALTGADPKPSPKALANAVFDAFKAPEPDGLSASIEFTNNLLPSGSLPNGAGSPLASGAKGRLWIQKGGDFRLELQSDAGDAQIVSRGDRVTVYDASSNTVYRATLPGAQDATKPGEHGDEKLTLGKVQRALDRLARTWTVSGARPTSNADRPTYTVKISPKDDGGLLGAAELAWDAVRGTPLRAAIYAQGDSAPVLELKATDVSYEAVPDSAVSVTPPASAKVMNFSPGDLGGAHDHARKGRRGSEHAGVQGVDAVRRAVDFDLVVPAKLAGLPRKDVRLVRLDGEKAALAIYGQGFGAIAVLQHKAKSSNSEKRKGGGGAVQLPEINIDGATGSELATALGTLVTFERDGVAYVVAGSVPPVAAENAARGLK